jgi:hypothetical protein
MLVKCNCYLCCDPCENLEVNSWSKEIKPCQILEKGWKEEKKRKGRKELCTLADDLLSGWCWWCLRLWLADALPTEENMTMVEIYGNWIFDTQLQEVTSSSRDEPTSPVMIISFELIHLYIQYHTFSTWILLVPESRLVLEFLRPPFPSYWIP